MSVPRGTVVVLNPSTRAYEGGRVLVGGSPRRLLRLSASARRVMAGRSLVVEQGSAQLLAERLIRLGIADPSAQSLPEADLGDLSVVVPVRDRPEALGRLLDALPPVGEVIVVDDASRDRHTVEDVTRRYGATGISMPRNRGPSACRNVGLARARTRYVAFVDSDVVVSGGTLEMLLRHFAASDVAAVAPRVRGLVRGGAQSWARRYENADSSLDLGPQPGIVGPQSRIGWVPGACLVVRRDVVGSGFDERMRSGEDVDLVWRLVAAGWMVRYEPAVQVRHEHRDGLMEGLRRRALYGSSVTGLAERHGDVVAPAVLTPQSTTLALALLTQRSYGFALAGAAWAVSTARLAGRTDGLDRRWVLAGRLSGHAAVAATTRTSDLMLRHWWPLAVVGACRSRRIRRVLAVAAAVDGLAAWSRTRAGLDPVRFTVARRLADLAYGAGAWGACIRQRSARGLLPAAGPVRSLYALRPLK